MSSSTNLTVSDSPFCCSQDCAKATVDAVSTSLSGQTLGSLSGKNGAICVVSSMSMARSECFGWLNTCFWFNRMDVEQTRHSSRGFSLPLVIQEMGSQTEFAWRAKPLSCSLAVSCSEGALIFGLHSTGLPLRKESPIPQGFCTLENEELDIPGVVVLSSLRN